METYIKKITVTKTDVGFEASTVYINPFSVDTSKVPEGLLSTDYKSYLSIEDMADLEINPFKLRKDDGTRIKSIIDWAVTLPLSSDDYLEEIRKSFVAALGCDDTDIILETI